MADASSCAVYTGFPPRLYWPSAVSSRKRQLAADLLAANIAATTCSGLSSTTLAQWSAFYAAAFDWSQSDTSVWGVGGQMDQQERYECALYQWQQELSSAGCKVVLQSNPNPASDNTSVGNAAKWVGVAVASVAGAFVVAKVAEVALEVLEFLPRKEHAR